MELRTVQQNEYKNYTESLENTVQHVCHTHTNSMSIGHIKRKSGGLEMYQAKWLFGAQQKASKLTVTASRSKILQHNILSVPTWFSSYGRV